MLIFEEQVQMVAPLERKLSHLRIRGNNMLVFLVFDLTPVVSQLQNYRLFPTVSKRMIAQILLNMPQLPLLLSLTIILFFFFFA